MDYAIYLLDAEGRVSSWNSGARRIKGYAAEEVIGRSFGIFFTEEDQRLGKPGVALEAARLDGKFAAEGWRRRKDGSLFWASVVLDAVYGDGGAVIGFAKVTRDMTQQRAAHQALLESERRFRLLVQGVTDYAIFMLDPQGRVTNWNLGARRIKGYETNEIIGQHFSRFYTEEDRAEGIPQRALAKAQASGHVEAEGWRVRKDGSLFWASVAIDAIHEADGSLLGFAKVTRDITERRNAQQKMDELRERIAQTQKLEALGELTGGIAHNFSNLLQVTLSGIRLAEKLAGENPKLRQVLAHIGEAAEQRAGLTRHLLAFSRKLPTQPTVIDTATCLRAAAELLMSSLRRNTRLELDLGDALWPLRVDVAQFELALLNVAVNARDAMPEGGVVTLSARNETRTEATPGLWGQYVAVRLRDNGTGIPREVLGRVLEPFFTTKPIGQGTGLGLSQAYGFAENAGGTVRVESEVGKGTVISFLLPAAGGLDAAALSQSRTERADADVLEPGWLARVLVVDDEPAVAQIAAEMLKSMGYGAESVTDPKKALQRLESGGKFDLIFSDVIMPGKMNGLDFAREIERRWPSMPVLLTTGYADGLHHGEFSVLRKPYTTLELIRAVLSLMRRQHPIIG